MKFLKWEQIGVKHKHDQYNTSNSRPIIQTVGALYIIYISNDDYNDDRSGPVVRDKVAVYSLRENAGRSLQHSTLKHRLILIRTTVSHSLRAFVLRLEHSLTIRGEKYYKIYAIRRLILPTYS